MPRSRKPTLVQTDAIGTLIKETIATEINDDINQMPLTSLAEYMAYNKRAREMNKKLRICRYPIKPCPEELHPKERVMFGRKDQPLNPLEVYLSNEMIDFKKTLEPGKVYDLPRCVIEYLSGKGTPHWHWVDRPDGSKETTCDGALDSRFTLRTVYES